MGIWSIISVPTRVDQGVCVFLKQIQLTQNQFTIVDDEDFETLNQLEWYACWNAGTKSYYALHTTRHPNGKRHMICMHRVILGLEFGDKRQGDHINHDTLDNRKENLRIVTSRENHENRSNQSKHGVGVQKYPNGKFRAYARVNSRYYHIGMFDTPQEAQTARIKFIKSRSSNE